MNSRDFLVPQSIGSLVKKMLELNPELTTQEIAEIIRSSTQTQSRQDFVSREVINESLVLERARGMRSDGIHLR